MANKYFVWKDANCKGVNPEWIEMDGRTFYAFTKDPANKDRRFVRLGNEVCEEADVIFLEATYEQYLDWIKEYSRNYRNRQDEIENPYKKVSLDDKASERHELTFNEVIADDSVNVEKEVVDKLHCEYVRKIVVDLPLEERHIIELMFYGNKTLSEREVARLLGITQTTLNYRKSKIFEKIKKSFVQN